MITQNEVLFVLLQELERRSSYGGPINTFINTSFEVKNDPNAQVLKWTEKIKKKQSKMQIWVLKLKIQVIFWLSLLSSTLYIISWLI